MYKIAVILDGLMKQANDNSMKEGKCHIAVEVHLSALWMLVGNWIYSWDSCLQPIVHLKYEWLPPWF